MGLPYQTLINSYLTDCAKRHVEPRQFKFKVQQIIKTDKVVKVPI
jgi:hypothetical protein